MKRNWETIYKESAWLGIKRIEHHISFLNFKGKRILDIGCWWGWFIKYAREREAQVDGFDYETNCINDAIEFLGNKKGLCVASAEQIPYKSDSFDIVFSYHVLEHIKKEYKMLKEIYRILKKCGDLILAVPNDYSFGILPYRPFRWLLKQKKDFLKNHNRYDWLKSITYSDISHHREYIKKSLCSILIANHFQIMNIKSYGFEMPYPIRNRLSKKFRVYISWLLGPIAPSFLRSELIVHAKKY